MIAFDDDPLFAPPTAPAPLWFYPCERCMSLRQAEELTPTDNRHACRDEAACAERAARRTEP